MSGRLPVQTVRQSTSKDVSHTNQLLDSFISGMYRFSIGRHSHLAGEAFGTVSYQGTGDFVQVEDRWEQDGGLQLRSITKCGEEFSHFQLA